MTDESLAAGSVVKLNSGGPEMTVREVSNDEALCEWFDKKMLRTHQFKLSSISKAPPSAHYDGIGFAERSEDNNE